MNSVPDNAAFHAPAIHRTPFLLLAIALIAALVLSACGAPNVRPDGAALPVDAGQSAAESPIVETPRSRRCAVVRFVTADR